MQTRHTSGNTGEISQAVDFPQFVAYLIEGMFDANLEVMSKNGDLYRVIAKSGKKSSSMQ